MMSSTTAKRSTSNSSTTTPIVRIELIGIDPPIWRRILCPSETTLDEFHVIVQRAMGWSNCHLHRFEIRDRDIGNVDYLEDERKFSLKDVAVNEHFVYEYDFGDSWEHDVHINKEVPRDANASYPVCVAGQRKCPPEDCGGITDTNIYSVRTQTEHSTRTRKSGLEKGPGANLSTQSSSIWRR